MNETPGSDDYVIDCGGAWLRPCSRDSVTVLQIGGEVDAQNADKLSEYACGYAANALALIVDMAAVEFLSVKGLRNLIRLNEQCHDSGIEWALVGSGWVRRMLRIGNTDRTFPMADSASAALQRITMATIGYGSGG